MMTSILYYVIHYPGCCLTSGAMYLYVPLSPVCLLLDLPLKATVGYTDTQPHSARQIHGHTIRMSKQYDWSVPCDSCVTNGSG